MLFLLPNWHLLTKFAFGVSVSSHAVYASSLKGDYELDKLGAVASESSLYTSIGIDILKQGGNAANSANSISFS